MEENIYFLPTLPTHQILLMAFRILDMGHKPIFVFDGYRFAPKSQTYQARQARVIKKQRTENDDLSHISKFYIKVN